MLNFNANFVIETNATDVEVGTVLILHDGPVACISKMLNSAQYNYYTMDHELLAIVLACKKYCPYLDSKKNVVLTDYKP